MQSETLLEKTHNLLINAPRHITDSKIAEEIKVSKAWLSMFKDGKIKNPGILTIQALHDFLANQ